MISPDWPIIILSLEGDEGRRQALTDALMQAGLPFRIFYGVDGRRGLPAAYDPLIDREAAQKRLRRRMTDAEFACALSHRAIYSLILDENLAGAVILEDDAIITPDFVEFIRSGLQRIGTMMLMDYNYGRALPWQRKALGRWTLHRAAQRATFTSSYSVSRSAAMTLLEATTPVSYVADWPVNLYEMGAWLVSPKLAAQGGGPAQVSRIGARPKASPRGRSRARTGFRWSDIGTYLRRRLSRPVGR